MHQRKSKKILIYFFLLVLVGSINNNSIKLHPVQKEIITHNEGLADIKRMQISISQCHILQ